MVTVDHNTNIQRIIDVIEADTSIFDSGATVGLLRSVEFGNPANMVDSHYPMPYCYVTTSDSLQKTTYPFGVSTTSTPSQITVDYKIVIVTHAKDKSVTSEKLVYSLASLMRSTLTADPTFGGIFSRSIINESKWNVKTKGQLTQVIEFILTSTIGTEFSLVSPIVGTVPLLSKPNSPEGVVFSEDRIQAITNRVLTPNGDFGAIFVEYQSTSALDASFRSLFGTEETITLNSGASARVVTIMYIEINPTAQFDEIERTILHMEVIAT